MVLLCLLVSAPIWAMNAQLFFPPILLLEKITFSFQKAFPKVSWKANQFELIDPSKN